MNFKLKILFVFFLISFSCKFLFAQENYKSLLFSKTVAFYNDTLKLKFVDNKNLYKECWDTLPQPRFWQKVITLSSDSCIINSAQNRKSLCVISNGEWKCQEEVEKTAYRDYLKIAHGLGNESEINVTTGKKEFYEYRKVVPLIGEAASVFIENGVDPWYAQTILLIESPGKLSQKSSVGAYGPFQLMKNVAKKYGLKINKHVDERTDLKKSAGAAAKLLGNNFIPRVKKMLDEKNISYNETDLWFRLLVMHAYHAGPGNVQCVIDEINPKEGGISLFTKIWQTQCRGFKNESQNYSQIALASIILFDKIINKEKDTVFIVQGDRMLSKYKKTGWSISDANIYLNNCIRAYESDLVEGSVPFDYFYKKIGVIQKEFAYLEYKNSAKDVKKNTGKVPLTVDQFLSLGDKLMKKKKVEDAIKVLKLNVEQNPNSAVAADSLGKAYKVLGKNDLALKYSHKSAALKSSAGDSE